MTNARTVNLMSALFLCKFNFADHFVIVSDTNAVPSGSLLSSTLSLEPFSHEELRPSLPPINIIEYPHIDTSEVFHNPIYEVGDVNSYALTNPVNRVHKNCIYQTNSYNDPSGNETDLEEAHEHYDAPVESVTVDSSKSAVPRPRVNNEMRSSSFKSTTISSAKGGHKKSEIQNDYTQSKVYYTAIYIIIESRNVTFWDL